jgi:hypothetical protein
MSQVCSKCSRVNPPDAAYCYYDGAILAGHSANGGAIRQGSAPFPSQFVFPSGQVCHNFDQLALACQQNWKAAVDLMKQGFLASFLGGLGRADLALAAQEAARFPDQDRGLDQLLSRFPTYALDHPKLKAEPTDINLGHVPMGTDRQIDLHLTNLGMRLLYGSVVSDCKWLSLGEAPGNPQKLFQFGVDTSIPVHIRGQHLRAGTKPLEGKLIIESNGGNATLTIRAEVPVKPFPEGVLSGAVSPRQVAEKALAQPKVAAPLFEKGSVAEWFTQNGWTYPVQGPPASGLGAVQQFFEALGLAKAPKVEISTSSLSLNGQVGQALQATIEVKSEEKRPVYAYATCDQPWVNVARAKLNGRVATIAVRVPSVPNRPGETLRANLHVTGNGNQRFVVPLALNVDGANPFAELTIPQPAALPVGGCSGTAEAFVPVVPAFPAGATANMEQVVAVAVAPPLPANVGSASAPFAKDAPIAAGAAAGFITPALPATTRRGQRGPIPPWVHLVPLVVLGLGLVGIAVRDVVTSPRAAQDLDVRLALAFDYSSNREEKKQLGLGNSFRFGLAERGHGGELKNLTYYHRGTTNSTMVKIDGKTHVFADTVDGIWDEPPVRMRSGRGMTGSWLFHEKTLVEQSVEIIAGEPSEIGGFYKQTFDTCLVKYRLKNLTRKSQRVGLRLLLDTLIGKNDGPTFAIPGLPNLVDTQMDFRPAKNVPDFVEVLEKPNIRDPGTVVHAAFRLGKKLEPPERVSLTHWPGELAQSGRVHIYDVPLKDIGKDSSLVLYWKEAPLGPGQIRDLGFTIGLGSVASGLTVGGNFSPGGELTVISLISDYKKDMTATLVLPKEFTLAENSKATQTVPAPAKHGDGLYRPSPVTWHVRSSSPGTFTFEVKSSIGKTQTQKVTIKRNELFGG